MDVLDLLREILEGDKYIHENLLKKPWIAVELPSVEMDDNSSTPKKAESSTSMEAKKCLKTLHEDEFAGAYREFICNGDFVNVLNHVAEELGFMLDFQWVDYVKKTLEFEQEIRWLELFKVFKINFTDDVKNLKEHMRPFSKKSNGQVVFDLNGALDGFLHFVWLKRHSHDLDDLLAQKTPLKIHEEFWHDFEQKIPKTLLWDSVFELLGKYYCMKAFDDGPRNFEPWSCDEDDTPSPNFQDHKTGRHLRPDIFNVHQPPLHGGYINGVN
ncbi:uncharacterized protein TNCV_842271 [Trichonephila clavipes]|nr:uncharacterized protein TNCV_842271 [Trichonephila clavipes]